MNEKKESMKKLGKCQVKFCSNKAEYGIFRPRLSGKKEWLYVCRLHEGVIGNENMHRAAGRYERVSAINFRHGTVPKREGQRV